MQEATLYIVATPIGNLEDITFRAVRILEEVKLIAAEDTRHTAKLLSHYNITTPVVSCHEHNEESRIGTIVGKLSQGLDVALVSDAGTPLISDPGYRVVKGILDAGFKVIPVPGPCAAIAGLSVSGLPTDSFVFAGFPNRKQGRRRSELDQLLEALKDKKPTIIFYESPHRIVRLVEDVLSVMGDRPAMMAREITKHYEEYLRGTLSGILSVLQSRPSIKGECALFVGWNTIAGSSPIKVSVSASQTILVGGLDQPSLESDPEFSQNTFNEIDSTIIAALESSQIRTSTLAKKLSRKYNIPRQDIYNRIVRLQHHS
ncbi:MAG: 16S rRNA (cytidine(1402)-2'-O)-methyltransferase [Desulfamplus sp.]|nr:16S rRNA (cytidine(1402)-2'-O)-methyltransferase [Desulfamplus sp.]